jgi:hypothetical protein
MLKTGILEYDTTLPVVGVQQLKVVIVPLLTLEPRRTRTVVSGLPVVLNKYQVVLMVTVENDAATVT